MVISSKSNPAIVSLLKLSTDKNWLVLDTPKLIFEAVKQGRKIETLLSTESCPHLKMLENHACNVVIVTKDILDKFSSVQTSAGIVAFLRFDALHPKPPEENFLVLDSLQDPGNIGTLLRTALGCGFGSVFLLDSVRSTNEKLVRSSMGALFSLKVYEMSKIEFMDFAKKNKLNLVICDMGGENLFKTEISKDPFGIVLGNEGNGISSEIRSLTNKVISLPMDERLESLNVAISGSIIMYQIKYGGKN